MAFKGKHLTEEHRRKISESNKGRIISLEQRKKISETLKERGIRPSVIFYAKREEHPLWKGGGGNIMAKKICQDHGKDLTHCEICQWIEDKNIPVIDKDKKPKSKRMIVHHIDGNIKNNNMKNLSVLCFFCHNAIHDSPSRRQHRFQNGHPRLNSYGFPKGHSPWNKGLENKYIYNNGVSWR